MEKKNPGNRNPSRALLLLNVGTPEQPSVKGVRKYLREFLMDPYVIDIAFIFRWILVHLLILPFRPKKSAAAYRKIWTDQGSPLLLNLINLKNRVQAFLDSKNPDWVVLPAMRYGKPSIGEAVQILSQFNLKEVVLFPLYPQYSLAATQTGIEKFQDEIKRVFKGKSEAFVLTSIRPFYADERFIKLFAQNFRNSVKNFSFDHVLFSFHGLPVRQVQKAAPGGSCSLEASCCEELETKNQGCYKAQCLQTARLIAQQLNLEPNQFSVCFQSRLGRTPWIQPYTDELLKSLPTKGVKNLAVLCPAFVSDCLETLEEIEMRGKADWIQAGGSDLRLVPSLNADRDWSEAVAQIAMDPTYRVPLEAIKA